MIVLFPSEPFSPREVDSSFKSEYEAAKLVGFTPYLFDHDYFVSYKDKKDSSLAYYFKTNLPFCENNITPIVLRGWMLNEYQYADLHIKLLKRGYQLINGPTQYKTCHHFPEYFKYISEHTSKAWWSNTWSEHPDANNIQNIVWEPVRRMLGGDIIIKDYVKSEKGNPDLFILNKELTNEEFSSRVERFIEARGKLFNKGLVFKSVEKLKKYQEQTNEWRMFFLNHKLVICNQNSDNPVSVTAPPADVIDLFQGLAKNVDSIFFTMDIAEKEDGSWMILELGDGQVSGLPLIGDALGFYNNFNNILKEIKE